MRKTLSIVILACASLMATAQQSNTVTIDPDGIRTEYNPMIFGQFIEHFDNQVYGGIFDPGNPLSDDDGFRTDVIEAMKDASCQHTTGQEASDQNAHPSTTNRGRWKTPTRSAPTST